MRTILKPMPLLIATALCACGSDQPPHESPPAPQAQVIAGPAIQALEKAKTVEATVQQQKADVDAAIEAQGQ